MSSRLLGGVPARPNALGTVHRALAHFLNGHPPTNPGAMAHLDRFLLFSEVSLCLGAAYLRKCLSAASVRRGDCRLFVKLYLACCLVAAKYINDSRILTSPVVAEWGLKAKEINPLERSVLSLLDFDLDILPRQPTASRRHPQTGHK